MADLARLFDGTGFIARESRDAAEALRRVADRYRVTLPKKFVELWSLEGITEFLHEHTNCDYPIAPGQLTNANRHRRPAYDAIASGYLPFMFENQHVACWAIDLNGGDDPPVYVDVDSGSPPTWQPHADSLSAWVQCVINDGRVMRNSWWQAQAKELTTSELKLLEKRFTRELTTHAWPGVSNYRFSNPDGALLLWNSVGQTDWMVAPADGRAAELLSSILDLSGLRKSLYGMNSEAENILQVCATRYTRNRGRISDEDR